MINFGLLAELFSRTAGRVKYKLGAKCALDADSASIKQIDCSGVVRWWLHRAAGIQLPDGSQQQLAWARANLRKLEKYSDVQYAAGDDSRLFIAFLSPKPGKAWPRHVWLVWKGKTMESYGGHGVGGRPWNHFARSCKDCFEVK